MGYLNIVYDDKDFFFQAMYRLYRDNGKENGNFYCRTMRRLVRSHLRWILLDTFLATCLYLGGQGDLVSRLIMGINGVTIWVIGVINLLTKSP